MLEVLLLHGMEGSLLRYRYTAHCSFSDCGLKMIHVEDRGQLDVILQHMSIRIIYLFDPQTA